MADDDFNLKLSQLTTFSSRVSNHGTKKLESPQNRHWGEINKQMKAASNEFPAI